MNRDPNRPDDLTVATDVRASRAAPSPDDSGVSAMTGRLAEGARFGVYVVGDCIGQGGMARVYRAQHEGLQRQVALKVLIDGVGHDGDAHERFLREARLAACIKHPNVVNIFDVGVCEGTPYLVMELLEGVDLDALVESKGKLDEATIIDVIVPIVAGLAAVHDAGIVHRDLKPGNIFLARGRQDELEPKLLDFGISKSIGADQMKLTSARGMLIGTPFYMSPEAARGADVTALSDQYALGVVLYECATGANPFAGANNFGEVVSRVSTGSYEPLGNKNPAISKRLISIIERAMHVHPELRFADMRAMGRELLLLAGERTRITWGMSFNSVGDLGNSMAPLSSSITSRPTRAPAKRLRRAATAGLLALTAVSAFWLTREEPAAEVSAGANSTSLEAPVPLPTQTSAARLEPERAILTPVEAVITAPPETERAVSAEPPAPEKSRADARRGKTSQKSAASNRRPWNLARSVQGETTPMAEAFAAKTGDGLLAPDWVPVSSEPVTRPGTGRGTNNAPILE